MKSKQLMFLLFVGVRISLLPLIAQGVVIPVDRNLTQQDIGSYLEFIEDRNGTGTIESIASASSTQPLDWKASPANTFGFGYTTSVYWLRFTIQNSEPMALDWLLHQEYPLIDYLTLYLPASGGGFTVIGTGDFFPFSQRPFKHRSFVFPVTTPARATLTYYLRCQSTSSLNISLKIWNPSAFQDHETITQPLHWMFYGAFGVMFLFNLLVLIYTRDITYFYYVCYIGVFTLLMLSLNGYSYQYLWPNAVWWQNNGNPFLISLTVFSIVQFARYLTHTRQQSIMIDSILKGYVGLSLLIIGVALVFAGQRFALVASVVLTGIASASGFCFAGYLAFSRTHQNRESLYFFIAFSFFLIGIAVFVLQQFGILPITFITNNGIQIGAAIEIVLLSLVLPDRLIVLKNKLLSLNKNLEQLVKARTTELESTQLKLVQAAHKAGMADMARDSVHAIGNIINSIKTTVDQLKNTDGESFEQNLKKANLVLRDNLANLETFILHDPKAKSLLEYYLRLEELAGWEQERWRDSIAHIEKKVNEVVKVIATQQHYVEEAYLVEETRLTDILEEVLQHESNELTTHRIVVHREFETIPKITVQKSKVVFIVSQIIENAIAALAPLQNRERTLRITVHGDPEKIEVSFSDNGIGIAPENLIRIFRHGFSTGIGKNGYGLHTCANYMAEMGGRIRAESQGPNQGATFHLDFPLSGTSINI
jgi:signal transduction histidine kinase